MQYYYAAIVNHPEIEFNAENNVPLIQIFDTKDMRDKWIRDNAGNPMVMQVSSAQAVKWIKYLFYNHRQSAIPSHLSNHGAVHYFLRDVSGEVSLILRDTDTVKHIIYTPWISHGKYVFSYKVNKRTGEHTS